jgi:hypothetical protein
MLNDDDFISPHRMVQRAGDFFELREEFRKQALASLRRREGLPDSERCLGAFYQREDGAFYREPPGRETVLNTTLYPNGKGGFSQWAVGTRKGLSIGEAEKNWGQSVQFDILEAAEDGSKLQDELLDLNRDAGKFAIAACVSHGEASEQAPGFEIYGTSDEEVDSRLQEYLKRGLKDV